MDNNDIMNQMYYVNMLCNASKAYGTIVMLSPTDFLQIVTRQQSPLVVVAKKSDLFSTHYRYLTSYRGLAFYCRSRSELSLPSDSEVIWAAKINIPEF